MNKRRHPLVGMPTHRRDLSPIGLPGAYLMGEHYANALAEVGIASMLVPLYEDPELLRTLYERMDGLFLAGGSDMDPAYYDESPRPELGPLDPDRDRVELQLLQWAIEDDLPLLAVCRGVQILNVAAGGSLYQDIPSQLETKIEHDYGQYFKPRDHLVHDVQLQPGTRLAKLMGVHQVGVNSLHHQAIRRLGEGFRISALAPDGVIEGIESTNGHFAVGVQWHPEALTKVPPMRAIFKGFADAMAA